MFSAVLSQKIEEKDGVKYIQNDKEGIWDKAGNPQLELKFIKSWGESESDDENLMFYTPNDIETDSDGNYYILDSGNHRIQKFGPEGNFIRSYGREGKGPGEFQNPIDIFIDDNNNIYVTDARNMRIQILNNEGEYIGGFNPEKGMGRLYVNSTGEIFISSGAGMVMIRMGPGGPDKPPEEPLFTVYNKKGDIINKLGKKKFFKDPMAYGRGNMFSFNVDQNENFYLNYRYINKIEKYNREGNLLYRAERKLRFKPKDIESGSGRGMMGMQEFDIISNGLAVDEKGNLFMVTAKRKENENEKGELKTQRHVSGNEVTVRAQMVYDREITKTDRFLLEIFNKDGILLKSKQLDSFVDNIKIIGNKLFIIDTNRTMNIYEYEISYQGL